MEVKRRLQTKNEFSKRMQPRRVVEEEQETLEIPEKTEIDSDLLGFDLSGKIWNEQTNSNYEEETSRLRSRDRDFYSFLEKKSKMMRKDDEEERNPKYAYNDPRYDIVGKAMEPSLVPAKRKKRINPSRLKPRYTKEYFENQRNEILKKCEYFDFDSILCNIQIMHIDENQITAEEAENMIAAINIQEEELDSGRDDEEDIATAVKSSSLKSKIKNKMKCAEAEELGEGDEQGEGEGEAEGEGEGDDEIYVGGGGGAGEEPQEKKLEKRKSGYEMEEDENYGKTLNLKKMNSIVDLHRFKQIDRNESRNEQIDKFENYKSYDEQKEVRIKTIDNLFNSFLNLKMFKVTESEIHIFAKELNTIIIIDRESFLESYFTLIEIDEPINDNLANARTLAGGRKVLNSFQPFAKSRRNQDSHRFATTLYSRANVGPTEFTNMGNSDFNEGYGGGGDSYAAPTEIGKKNPKMKASFDSVDFRVSSPKADDYEDFDNAGIKYYESQNQNEMHEVDPQEQDEMPEEELQEKNDMPEEISSKVAESFPSGGPPMMLTTTFMPANLDNESNKPIQINPVISPDDFQYNFDDMTPEEIELQFKLIDQFDEEKKRKEAIAEKKSKGPSKLDKYFNEDFYEYYQGSSSGNTKSKEIQKNVGEMVKNMRKANYLNVGNNNSRFTNPSALFASKIPESKENSKIEDTKAMLKESEIPQEAEIGEQSLPVEILPSIVTSNSMEQEEMKEEECALQENRADSQNLIIIEQNRKETEVNKKINAQPLSTYEENKEESKEEKKEDKKGEKKEEKKVFKGFDFGKLGDMDDDLILDGIDDEEDDEDSDKSPINNMLEVPEVSAPKQKSSAIVEDLQPILEIASGNEYKKDIGLKKTKSHAASINQAHLNMPTALAAINDK